MRITDEQNSANMVTINLKVSMCRDIIANTVEPLNKGHFGSRGFVLFRRLSSGGRFKPIGHL